MLMNSETGYGLVSKLLHWLIALVVLTLIGVGMYMTELDKDAPARAQIYGLHKAFGVTVLGLVVLRVLWLKLSSAPALPAGFKDWERILSKTVKVLLYILMLLTPVAGYLMSNAAGKPISWFGVFEMPALLTENEQWQEILGELHEVFAFSMLGLVGLHVAGALKHRFVDKDPSLDVLKRML
jgi:cytochrome b561